MCSVGEAPGTSLGTPDVYYTHSDIVMLATYKDS